MRMAVFYRHLVHSAEERGISVAEALRWARDLGIEGVEVDGDKVDDAQQLAAELTVASLEVTSIYSVYGWDHDPEDGHGAAQVKLAEVLGSKFLMPVPGFFSSNDSDVRASELKAMTLGLAELEWLAGRHGITCIIEDYDSETSPISTIEGMVDILNQMPNLRVALDTGNFCYSAQDVLHAYDVLSKRISHVHLKDRLILAEKTDALEKEHGTCQVALDGKVLYPCPVGAGDIPIEEILGRLKRDGYEGFVTIEHFYAPSYTDFIERSAAWLSERI